jgi:hypothetical protein
VYHNCVSTVYRYIIGSVVVDLARYSGAEERIAEVDVPTLNWVPCGGIRRLVSFGWQAPLESVDYWPMVKLNPKTFGGKPKLVAVFGCDW